MKKLSLLSSIAILLMGVFMLPSCSDDPIVDPPIILGPDVRLVDNGNGSLTTSTTVDPGATFLLNVTASQGDNPMNSLTITEDGTNVDATRLNNYDGVNNPALLAGDNATSIDWDIPIDAPTAAGTYTYVITVADSGNQSESVSIDITIESAPPTLAINGSTSITADPDFANIIKVTGTVGSTPLRTISVAKDGVDITDLTRLDFRGVGFTTNPLTLEGDDVDGFTDAEVLIRGDGSTGTFNYTITVEDEGGQTASTNLEVIVDPSTPITSELNGVLLNAGGPINTGGLDLATGNGNIGSSDAAAHIKDEGIDAGPLENNWIQRISGVNGSVIKIPDTNSLPEGFSFASVSSKEEIAGAFDTGIALELTNGDGELTTDNVQIGDLYVIQNGGVNYMIEITEVNVTSNDNTDNYVMNIKY